MSTDTLEDTRIDEKTEISEPGDHDTFKHYAHIDQINESMLNGTPVTALCGKVWVPTKDFAKYPLCQTCKDIFDSLPPGE